MLLKDELDGKTMMKFISLAAKTSNHLVYDGDENKNAKDTKICVINQKLKFEDYKNFLGVTQLGNEINYPEENKLDVDSLSENNKYRIKSNRFILRSWQRFKSKNAMYLLKKSVRLN